MKERRRTGPSDDAVRREGNEDEESARVFRNDTRYAGRGSQSAVVAAGGLGDDLRGRNAEERTSSVEVERALASRRAERRER